MSMGCGKLHLINAALPLTDERTLFELIAEDGRWTQIRPQTGYLEAGPDYAAVSQAAADSFREDKRFALDLEGRQMLPGLVDAHMHLDKAYSLPKVGNRSGTLLEAIRNYKEAAPGFTKEEIKARIRKAALKAVSYGTTAIRTHLDFNLGAGAKIAFDTVHAALEAKEELKGIVDLQLFPMCPYNGAVPDRGEVEEALKLGMTGIGGAPHLSETPERDIDRIFELAARYGVPIDLHTDESDDPGKRTVSYIADKTVEYGYQGKVTVDHLCALSAMEDREADGLIRKMADAGLFAVTLPPVNMYLQGRGDRGLIRRGTTRVRELIAAGVPLASASDNIQDPFHPFGCGDLLQIGLITAYAAHMGSPAELRHILRMLTDIPARILGLERYGIAAGNPADFVVLGSRSVDELFAEPPADRLVYKHGRWLHVSLLQRSGFDY